jgi:uncharacterized protein (DUF305 family)
MLKGIITAASAYVIIALPALAQDIPSPVEPPEICKSGMRGEMGSMNMGMKGMDQAHKDLAEGMHETNAMMMQGLMADDIDVAFVCAMLPHHQGAINMARAELAHGDNEWAREMAQKIIDTQEKEIAGMLEWLKEQK